MKTLDEVIKGMEDCQNMIVDCEHGCPMLKQWEPECEKEYLALHYLREYRDAKDALEEAKKNYILAACACKNNLPLTWDELRTMFHRPVWIETTAKKGWNIIVSIDIADMQVIHTAHRGPRLSGFSRESLGKTWQAYRKERE